MRAGSVVKLMECDWERASHLRLQGLTVRQIADRFGVAFKTLKTGLARRRRRLVEINVGGKTSAGVSG
jgi:lambda repressor-like predicted transcriptional regulator